MPAYVYRGGLVNSSVIWSKSSDTVRCGEKRGALKNISMDTDNGVKRRGVALQK